MSQSDVSGGKRASVLEFVLTIVFAIALFWYIVIAAYTKDALWLYWPFETQPAYAVVRCYGKEILLEKDSADLARIAAMVNERLSGRKRWDELNLTDQTFEEYRSSERGMTLNLYYAERQRLHSASPFFSGFTSLLIPLDGRHAKTFIVFALINDRPSGGSFHVESFQPIVDYLGERQICVKP